MTGVNGNLNQKITPNSSKTQNKLEAPPITLDQLPHVVSGLSEKLDRVLDILEKFSRRTWQHPEPVPRPGARQTNRTGGERLWKPCAGKAALAEVEKYLAENHGTPVAKLRYEDYTNGASFFSKDAVFAPSLVIFTDSVGLYNLPDNVMMLVSVTSIKDENWFIEELGKFILFLKELGTTHHIQHFAIAFSKDKPDHPSTVQTADVTCLRFY